MTSSLADARPPIRGPRLYLLFLTGALALAGCLQLLAGPALYRLGVVDLQLAMWGLASSARWTLLGGCALSVVALIVNLLSPPRRGGVIAGALGLICLIGVLRLQAFELERSSLPPLHDVQTDWSHPVPFTVRALEVREASGAVAVRDDAVFPEDEGSWAGRSFAEVQGQVYDLKPLRVGVGPGEAAVTVADAAKRLGWLVMLNDPPNGQVEAVVYSRWYALAYDVAVRVTPEGSGSRIDVRSVSRQTGPDMGANASLVKALIDEVSFALRGRGDPEGPPPA
jgi:fatty-acyl-CoA synthase